MGLGSFKTAWQRQTLRLGHEKAATYSVLLIDNRGMGDSDKPLLRYSTSEMARDVLEVLEHPTVGFLAAPPGGRRLHVVGISMGGMIAQELAVLVPGRLSTLTLSSTAASVEHTGTFMEKVAARASLVVPRGPEASVRLTAAQNFSAAWMARPDDVHLPRAGTPGVRMPKRRAAAAAAVAADGDGGGGGGEEREVDAEEEEEEEEEGYRRFDSNYQRFVAQEMHKRLDTARFSLKGFLCQLVAAGWHHKSPEQLRAMADLVGRERIMVVHGTEDGMINVVLGRRLIEYVQPGVSHILEGKGHALPLEMWEWFNDTLEERFRLGEKLDGRLE